MGFLAAKLVEANVYLICDRDEDYSTNLLHKMQENVKQGEFFN